MLRPILHVAMALLAAGAFTRSYPAPSDDALQGSRLQLQHRAETIRNLVFSQDGSFAASAGTFNGDRATYAEPEFIRLWSCQSRSILWTYDPNKGKPGHFTMNAIGFSAAGEVLVDHRTGELAGLDRRRPVDPKQLSRRELIVLDTKSGSVLRRYSLPPLDHALRLSIDHHFLTLEEWSDSTSSLTCLDVTNGKTERRSTSEFVFARQQETANPEIVMQKRDGTIVRASHENRFTRIACGDRWSKTIEWHDISVESIDHLCSRTTGSTQSRWHDNHYPINDLNDRWIVVVEKYAMGGAVKCLRILDSTNGHEVFFLYINGRRASFYMRPNSTDLWLVTTPAHEGNESTNETMFGVINLSGNPRFRQAPLDGQIQVPASVCCVENRYIIAASSEATMVWCWDIQSLRCLWAKVPTCPSEDGGNVVVQDGLVHLSCGGNSDWYRLKDGARVNKPSNARRDERSVQMSSALVVRLQHFGFRVPDVEDVQNGKLVTRSGNNVIFRNGDEASFHLLTQDGKRAIFSSSNGIEVLNLSTGARVTLIASHGATDEWIAHSEDGYFEASAGGGRLLAVINGTEAFPIDQFADRYNRPDILLERLDTADQETVAHLRQRHERHWAKFKPSGGAVTRPLSAKIVSATVVANSAKLRLSFQDDAADLASFQIYLNDVPLFGRDGKPLRGRSADQDATIILNPGNNKIEISCTNHLGVEAPRVLRYLESPAVATSGKLYFLGIGVSDYRDSEINPLHYAHKDALDLAALFKEMTAYTEIKALTLVNGDATGAAIESARKFVETAAEEDTLILFVSGHGVQIKGEFFFLPVDAEVSRLAETGVALKKLEDLLFATKARRRLVLMDACASGDESTDGGGARAEQGGRGFTSRAFRPKSTTAQTIRTGNIDRFVQEGWQTDRFSANDLFRRSGAVVLSSCGANEESLEHDRIQNGLFTRAVIDAFSNGRADNDRDGRINKRELRDFVRDRVRALVASLVEKDLPRQTPSLDRDNLEEPMLLPIVGAPSASVGGDGGTYRKTVGDGALVWIEKSQTNPFAAWDGDIDLDGYASGYGHLSLRPTKHEPDILAKRDSDGESGVMVRGRFEGRTTLLDAEGLDWERWWENGVPTEKVRVQRTNDPPPATAGPSPLVGPSGGAGYMRTEDNRAWVWNNTPRPADAAAWEGAIDDHGFASGQGVLKWFKGRKFVTSYVGAMERGRLTGRTVSTDASGAQREIWWSDGRKVDGLPPARSNVPAAPSENRFPLARADGTAGYMKTRDGRAWVWNNAPRPDDEVEWSGSVDENGLASGAGVLRWFKGSRFFTQYEGKTVAGRLDGPTVSTDASGSRTVRIWRNGTKQ